MVLRGFQSGLAVLDEGVSILDLVHNPKRVEDLIARQKPRYVPGITFQLIK